MMSAGVATLLGPAAFWAAFLAMYLLEARLRRRETATASADRRSRDRIGVALVGAFLLAWLLSRLPLGRWEGAPVFWSGVGLMLAGFALRLYAIRTLGRAFSVYAAVRAGQSLVQSGPYRYLRHPAYTGVFLWLVGIGLALGNLVSLIAVVAIPFLWGYRYRIQVEESLLLGAWGDAYRDYMGRTYRLVPFLW